MTKQKGVLAVIISATIFGSLPLMAKAVYNQGSNPISLVFYRFFLVLPFLYILTKKGKNENLEITKEELKQIIIVTVFGYALTALLLFMSYNYIPSGMATTLHFTYPIFVILGCIIFFKEKVSIIKILSVILCFLGIMAFYGGDGEVDFVGIGLAFTSGITYAFYTIYIDKSGLKKMNTFKLTFYLCLVSSIMIFIFGIITKSLIINMKPIGWIISLLLAILAGLGGVNLYQVGIQTIGPQDTSILSTFEPITSIVLSVLILNEPFGIKTALGVVLILAAVILVSVFENKDKDRAL